MSNNTAAKPYPYKVKREPELHQLLEGFHALHVYIAADINLTTTVRRRPVKSMSEPVKSISESVKAFVKTRIENYLQRAIEELHADSGEEYGLLFDKRYMQIQFTPGDAVKGIYKSTDIRVVLKPLAYADCNDTLFLDEEFILRTDHMDYYASTNQNNITKIASVMTNDPTTLISVSAVTEEDYSECREFALAHAIVFDKSDILMSPLSTWDRVVLKKDDEDVTSIKVNDVTIRK